MVRREFSLITTEAVSSAISNLSFSSSVWALPPSCSSCRPFHPTLCQFRRRFRVARLVSLSHFQSCIRCGACRFRGVGRLGRPDNRSRPCADHQRARYAHHLARVVEHCAAGGLHRDKRLWLRRVILSHSQRRRQRIRKYANCERTGDDRVGMGVRLLPGPLLSVLGLCSL